MKTLAALLTGPSDMKKYTVRDTGLSIWQRLPDMCWRLLKVVGMVLLVGTIALLVVAFALSQYGVWIVG